MDTETTGRSSLAITLAEKGILPDPVVRWGMRRLLGQRLREIHARHDPDPAKYIREFTQELERQPIADQTGKANEQHYELPTDFFDRVLGPRRKYSACLWDDGVASLAEAEEKMLQLTCRRAGLRDGMRILELGCGWGSLTLWMAQAFPNASIRALTNSRVQAAFVANEARKQGRDNVDVVHGDINVFAPRETCDRIVTVEMLEHVRNYRRLFDRFHDWLVPGGKMFVHIFAHREIPYLFETEGASDWMGRFFFSGGTMPSEGLLERCCGSLRVEERWWVSGTHYGRTLNAWLALMDAGRDDVMEILRRQYGAREAAVWFQRWRMFFMACAELFDFKDGREWGVAHSLFARS